MRTLPVIRSDEGFVSQSLSTDAIKRHREPIPVFHFAVVEPEGFAIDVGRKVKRLDADMRSLDAPLEQRPEVLQPIRVDRAAHIRFGMVDKIVSVVCG